MYRLIVNPVSGTGESKAISEAVCGALKQKGIPHDCVFTASQADGKALAEKAAQEGIDTVLVLGGDGTLREVAHGLLGGQTALGIIPCGTGNDFVKAVHIPMKPMEALEFALSKPPRPVDTCTMNDLFFLNVAGCGLDVSTLVFADWFKKKHMKGIMPYLLGLLKAIAVWKPIDMTIRVDGKDMSRSVSICAVGNGTCFGGGIPILSQALPDDGALSVNLVDALSRRKIVANLPKLLKGTLWKESFSHYGTAQEVFISYPDMKLELDGEILSVDSALIRIHKASLLLHY